MSNYESFLQKLMYDHLNDKTTLMQALATAYSFGYSDGRAISGVTE